MLQGGYVASADTAKAILMRPHPGEPSKKNILYNAGVINTLILNKIEISSASYSDYSKILPSQNHVGAAGKYNSDFISKLDDEISKKFPKHPPIKLDGVKEDQVTLFSYVFKKVELPSCFEYCPKDLKFKGRIAKYIQYSPAKDEKKQFQVYQTKDSSNLLALIEIEGGDILYFYTANGCPDLVNAWKDAQYVLKNNLPMKRFNDEFILFPEIDLFVNKHYTNEELNRFFLPSKTDFSYIEDWLKVKISPRELKTEKKDFNPTKSFVFDKKIFIAIAKKGGVFPYIAMMVNSPEILKY